MTMVRVFTTVLCALGAFSALTAQAAPPTAFTYQGQLKYRGVPANGEARFTFTLWDAEVEGRQVADPADARLVVVNGLFSTPLDFGSTAFNGEPRWLEITVATPQGEGRLTPRQPVTPTPVALFALSGNQGPRGLSGPAGTSGLACWDLNGDGVQDRAEDVNGDGAFNTLDCQGDGGAGGLTLPYDGTNITDDRAFTVTNVGLGGTAAFSTINPDNTQVALGVMTTGSGPGVMAITTGGGPAISGATGAAGGHAGSFSVLGTTATQAAIKASNEALGSAAHFETTNTESTADVFWANTNGNGTTIHARTGGTGRTGFLEVDYIGTRTLPALEVVTNGRGGGAGLFKATNFLNTSAALAAEAAGDADAIKGVAKGSGAAVLGYNAFGGNAVVGTVDGDAGRAGLFRSIDSTNPNPTVEAIRSGSGSAGRFENPSAGGLAGEFVGDVSVTGAVEAGSFQHRAQRTHYLSLSAFDFVPDARGLRWERKFGPTLVGAEVHSDNGKRHYLGAAVHLPHGAVVTGVKVFYYHDGRFDFPLYTMLVQRRMWNGGEVAMATMVSPDHTVEGVYNMATTGIVDATIDNLTFAYWVYAGLESACTDDQIGCDPASIQGVSISYTKEID